MPDDIAKIAGALSPDEAHTMLSLAEPWLMGGPEWKDYEHRIRFYNLRLVDVVFPEAKPGDSGRQFWRFNKTGLAVREYLETNNG